jgi:O-antigen/teichoic acid export membrane protein
MLLAATFAINSALNFILGLLIARFLGPEQFGLYALGAALMVLIYAVAIDWLKLSTMRFYSLTKRASDPTIRATLDAMAALSALALIGILITAIVAGVDLMIPTAIASAAVAAGVLGGLFDYQQAVARAREEDAVYARMVIIKNALAFLLMVGGAWWLKDPALVLAGSALSSLAAVISVRRALADAPLALRSIERSHVRVFAAYAFPLVATNVLMLTIPLLNRSYMASAFGLAEAGYFALASDIGVKLLATLGTTLEIMLLPLAVKALDLDGIDAAHHQIRKNLTVIIAAILPVAAGLLVTLPTIEALVVPKAFHDHVSTYMWILMPAFIALPLMQVGFNPVYLISRKTLVSTLSAVIAVAVNAVLIGLLFLGFGAWLGPMAVAGAMSVAFVSSALVVGTGAMSHRNARPQMRDLALVAAGLALMVSALWPFRDMPPSLLGLMAQGLAGLTIYGGVMLAGDVACCRSHLMALIRARRVSAPA